MRWWRRTVRCKSPRRKAPPSSAWCLRRDERSGRPSALEKRWKRIKDGVISSATYQRTALISMSMMYLRHSFIHSLTYSSVSLSLPPSLPPPLSLSLTHIHIYTPIAASKRIQEGFQNRFRDSTVWWVILRGLLTTLTLTLTLTRSLTIRHIAHVRYRMTRMVDDDDDDEEDKEDEDRDPRRFSAPTRVERPLPTPTPTPTRVQDAA